MEEKREKLLRMEGGKLSGGDEARFKFDRVLRTMEIKEGEGKHKRKKKGGINDEAMERSGGDSKNLG